MQSAPAETFELRRSRRLLHCMITGYLVAGTAVVLWQAPLPVRFLLGWALLASLWISLRRPWPVHLRLGADGWTLTDSRGHVRHAGAISGGRLLPGVTAITFSGGSVGSVVLLADAFKCGRPGRLRALLRHRSAPPS